MNEGQKFWIFFLAILGLIVFLVVAVYIILAYPPPRQYIPTPFPPPP
jgi:uncharacterized membrane protein